MKSAYTCSFRGCLNATQGYYCKEHNSQQKREDAHDAECWRIAEAEEWEAESKKLSESVGICPNCHNHHE